RKGFTMNGSIGNFLSRLSRISPRRPRTPKPARPAPRLRLEALEQRDLLSGTWNLVTTNAPGTVGTMMLLSDGTVMTQQGGNSSQSLATNSWYRLSPSLSGTYVDGSWSSSAIASMSLQRLWYASNVLPGGKVFVVGGEYSGS